MQLTVDYLKQNNRIIYETISGSRAYGTHKPTSDIDHRGVYVAPYDHIIGTRYQEQVSDATNDTTYYELGRFLQLAGKQNPNILEMLYMPEDCITQNSPVFKQILDVRDVFLTKSCAHTFGGYAVSQIKKARGLNKKINKPMPVKRKTVLDFCYVPWQQGSVPVLDYLDWRDINHENCGLTKIAHMRDTYFLYHDRYQHKKSKGYPTVPPEDHKPLRGIVKDINTANDVCLSDVSKEAVPLTTMSFNKDGYSVHCDDYKSYKEWEDKRNPDRYEVTVSNGNDYDAKNMMHCIRLLRMAKEIAMEKTVKVRRPDAADLMRIRNGEASYDELILEADGIVAEITQLFNESTLPLELPDGFVNNMMVDLRMKIYSGYVNIG